MIFGSRIYAAGGRKCSRLRGCSKNKHFEHSEILSTFSKPPALSSDLAARQKGFVIDFIILWLIFYISNMLEEKEKQKQ